MRTRKKAVTIRPKRKPAPIFLDDDDDVPKHIAPNIKVIRRRGDKLIAFGWYGGKFSHLDWLLPLLPECHHYCEPFAGSAAVLINRKPSPVETYNDIDGEVTNFFRVLREFCIAVSTNGDRIPKLERARRFYVRARQTRTGLAQTSSLGRWANCKNTSRAGMSGVVSRWVGGIGALGEIADRLARVQIENRPAVEVIKLYDAKETLFYVDPPYVHDSRGDAKAYGYEMTDAHHEELAAALHRCKGKVAISGYRGSLMDTLYKDWFRHHSPEKMCHSVKQARSEMLWTNF
jgi:DNA adenine methylase